MIIFVFGHIWFYSITYKNGRKRNRKREGKKKI